MAMPAANIAIVVIATMARPNRELGCPCMSFLSDATTSMATRRNGASNSDHDESDCWISASVVRRVRPGSAESLVPLVLCSLPSAEVSASRSWLAGPFDIVAARLPSL
jgi:hypothetical protein